MLVAPDSIQISKKLSNTCLGLWPANTQKNLLKITLIKRLPSTLPHYRYFWSLFGPFSATSWPQLTFLSHCHRIAAIKLYYGHFTMVFCFGLGVKRKVTVFTFFRNSEWAPAYLPKRQMCRSDFWNFLVYTFFWKFCVHSFLKKRFQMYLLISKCLQIHSEQSIFILFDI